MSELSKLNTRAPLDRSPNKNWVENSGGLPMYIRRIANHLHAEKGMTIGHAIAVAVNAVKKMCATGDLNWKGKQSVNAGSRGEACAAVASWEAKKAGARVSKGILGRKWSDDEFIAFLVGETDVIHKCGALHPDCGCETPKKKKKKIKKRKFTKEQRKKAATVPGTDKFPIENQEDLENANRLKGKGKGVSRKQVEAHMKRQAKKKGLRLPKSVSKVAVTITDEEFNELVSKIDAEINTDTVTFDVVGDIEKRDDEKQLVFGWCSIAKQKDGTVEVDKQGDVLEDIDQMEKVAYDFVLHSRDGGEMHVRKGVSTLVESFVSTPEKWEAMEIPEGTLPIGWWVGFKVNDSEVWKAVKDGKYKMFSVHGSGTRKALD